MVLSPQEVAPRQPVASESAESIRPTPFRVFLPGLTPRARQLTGIRELLHSVYHEEVFVPSSLLSREGYKRHEGVRRHLERLSQEILQQAQGKDLEFIVQSAGGHEVMDLLKRILDTNPDALKGKHVSLHFISTPGFTGKGLEAVIASARNLHDIGRNVALYEQHMLYPLPDTYYGQEAMPHPPNTTDIFVDSSQQRQERRDTFLQDWLPKILPGPPDSENSRKREQIGRQLHMYDEAIKQAITAGLSPQPFIQDRAALLAPYLQDVFDGKHIDEGTHDRFLEQYRETRSDLASLSRFYINYMLYFARIARRIKRGTAEELAQLVETGKTKGVDIGIQFTLLQRDPMLPPEQFSSLQQQLSSAQIGEALEGFRIAQQYAHSTLGYYPDLLVRSFNQDQHTQTS